MKILRVLSLLAVFVVAGMAFTHSLGSINQDIGRHLKLGEIVWQTKSVPKTNLFSYTEPNTPFINTHWLSEIVLYLLNLLVGLKGLIVFKAGVLLLTLWFLWQAVAKKVEPWSFAVASLSALFIFQDRTDVRPEIFSYLFLAYFLFAIFRAKYSQKYTWLYAIPLVEVLWVNAHIYFILGPAVLGLFAIDRWVNNDSDWKFIAKITGLSILATCINPNSIYGALAPLTILHSYGYSIVENQSVLFLKNYGILLTQINIFILSTVALWLSFIPALKKYGFKNYIFEIGTALAFTILGFDMIRNVGPYVVVYVPILALNLHAWLSEKTLKPKVITSAYLALMALCVLLMNAVIHNDFYQWAGTGDRFGLEISASAQGGVDFVKENNIQGPVFNNFDVGSYLIWKLYPQQRVFVDGRPEAYTSKFFSDIYEPMQEDPATWNHYANDVYHINYIFFDYHDITPWAQTFLSFISQDKNWPLVYQDNSVVIFVRRDAQNLPLIQKYMK